MKWDFCLLTKENPAQQPILPVGKEKGIFQPWDKSDCCATAITLWWEQSKLACHTCPCTCHTCHTGSYFAHTGHTLPDFLILCPALPAI